jgi:hypothetical protein
MPLYEQNDYLKKKKKTEEKQTIKTKKKNFVVSFFDFDR